MSKQTDQLNKTIESYQKKADSINTDYGNANLTHRRAQQLAENQRKAGKFIRVVNAAKVLLEMHNNPPFLLTNLEKISTGAELEFILFDSYPTPIENDTPEWAVKDRNYRYRLAEKIGIADTNEFAAVSILVKKFSESSMPTANSFSESTILLKYPGIRNIPGFFPTPRPLIDQMMELAEIEPDDLVLEPSAGFGSICDVIAEIQGSKEKITCFEIQHQLREILEEKGYHLLGDDVLDVVNDFSPYHKVIMNPPFEKMQDIEHVKHCYGFLKTGGKLVSITSTSWPFNSTAAAKSFREWIGMEDYTYETFQKNGEVEIMLDEKRVYIRKNADGAFKSSFNKTAVATLTIVIDKFE